MSDQPKVSVIIVNWNSTPDTINCIDSILRWTHDIDYEIIVVDNASDDGATDIKKQFPSVQLIESVQNLGFAGGNNLALASAQGQYVLFLNPDTILENDAISLLVGFLDSNPQAGICGGSLRNQDGSPGIASGNFPTYWHVIYRTLGLKRFLPKSWEPVYGLKLDEAQRSPNVVDWVSGANLCIRKNLIDAAKGFEPDYFFSFDDVDLCYRVLHMGYKTYLVPGAEILHLRPNSFKKSGVWFRIYFYASEFIFFKKHRTHSYWVYWLNLCNWSLQYFKKSFRKKERRAEFAMLLQNLRAIHRRKDG